MTSTNPPLGGQGGKYSGIYYLCPNFWNIFNNNNYLIQWGNGFLNIKVLIFRR
jgi:hypothetical protein